MTASISPRFDIGKWLLVAAIATLGCMSLRTITSSDYWLHLATGKAIIDHGIGAADTLSVVSEGKAWRKTTWLYDVIMARVHGAAGGGVVTLLHMASLLGAFTLVARLCSAWSGAAARGISVLLVSWIIAAQLEAGPSLLTLILPAIMLYRLQNHSGSWALLAWLVPLQVLWANLHPSFIIAPILPLAYGVEALSASRTDASQNRRMVHFFTAAALLAIIPLLNPEFSSVYAGGISWITGGEANIARMWTSPYLSPFADKFTLGRGGPFLNPVNWLLANAAVGWVLYRQAIPLARTIIAFTGIGLVFLSYENSVLIFGLLVLPFLSMGLQTVGTVLGEMAGAGSGRPSPAAPVVPGLFLIVAIGTMLSFVSNGYYVKKGMPAAFGLGSNLDVVPAAAMDVINRPDFPRVFVNLPLDGGYIEWKTSGRKAFIDGRVNLHGTANYMELLEGLLSRSGISTNKLFQAHHPGAVVLNCGTPKVEEVIGHLLQSGIWSPAYFDGSTLIMALRNAENKNLIMDEALQKSGLALIDQSLRAYESKLGGFPSAPIPARLVGAGPVLMLREQFKEALAVYNALQAGAPTMVAASVQKGICLLRLDKREEAVQVLEKARDQDPLRAECWYWLGQAYESVGKKEEAKEALGRAKSIAEKVAGVKKST